MTKQQYAVIDNIEVQIEGERNLLELIRKAHIELPTFCYHSEISVYGACRMCMVEVQGRGIVPACSTPASDGMVVSTSTKQIRDMRKIIVELMLANHDQSCTTCPKSGDCRLQKIAHQMGIKTVRFKKREQFPPQDLSSVAISRDPAKCVLCGDCVRVCKEIQSVGVLDFAGRGAKAIVTPFYKKGIGEVDCVNCGQCVKICPVGALTPNNQVSEAWDAIHDKSKTVVVQIAPAVRVAIGENFGYQPGEVTIGQLVTALRMMGFDKIYDTSFAADFTVIEEGNEFLARLEKGEKLPQFTSCCPAWVKFAEQYYPELLPNISTCRSPQQMFGALCKEKLTKELNISREDLVVVSIMPCTAKKFEASRPEFAADGSRDVDIVLTTQELALMIKERGIDFGQLDVGAFDMPFGFKSGAAVIFGTSGGVSEAVLRYASDTINKEKFTAYKELRVDAGLKIAEVAVGGKTLRLAIVSGLGNARELIKKIRSGEEHFDLVEVMACCGGCVNGGGQPLNNEHITVQARAKGLYDNDVMLQVHSSEENPYLQKMYSDDLDAHKAHKLLHTHYTSRK
ncbi:NAD(P)-dependent iron-only hydrogenase catalytic subunit [Sporobacter termitidis DSM 10068]|uniref:NAD(P)-dependent iron-only hydrogenase catalytic subunit n=1 Tax=Sporobacter termitidis DSM 10068 TaxID=1123282 RepID=A0A1M5XS79_9FIRM|nr:[FeFe] hydrogenase, group A [Sporobacter termitidis]SHI02640.1 NAD(P)-dependent iron-only hydrogenase catalytic subunit [Sporobacter termitidis DSM 10068]